MTSDSRDTAFSCLNEQRYSKQASKQATINYPTIPSQNPLKLSRGPEKESSGNSKKKIPVKNFKDLRDGGTCRYPQGEENVTLVCT